MFERYFVICCRIYDVCDFEFNVCKVYESKIIFFLVFFNIVGLIMRYLFFIVFNKLYFFLVIIFLYFFDFGFKIFNEIVFFMLIYLFVCGFIILVMGKI